ncbi:unnamed protein product [Closterium sp. NIES-53]
MTAQNHPGPPRTAQDHPGPSRSAPNRPGPPMTAQSRQGPPIMEVAQTSMCHAGAPQFLWPHAFRYTAHQLNLLPSDARPRLTPCSLWTGSPCVAAEFHRPIPVVSGVAGGAVAEGEGAGAARAGGVGSGDAGGVCMEVNPEEDTAASTRRPCPASPPGFPSVLQFPLRSSLRPVAAEPGGVPAGGTGHPGVSVVEVLVVGLQPQQERAEEERAGTVIADARGGGAAATATSLSSSQWTCRSPLSRVVSPEPRRSRYRADGPFHIVICSCIPPPPVLPHPPESSLAVLHDPLSDYLHASRPVVSHVLSALVSHPTAPLSSVPALVTTDAGFASSHRLDYATHLVSGPAHSLSSGGNPIFPLEVLEDRQLKLGFLAAAVPHLCTMLLALEGDLDALDIPVPRTHAEAVSGPWASYRIAAEEADPASYRSTGTYIDAVPPHGVNVVSGMWLYKVKRPPGSLPILKARYVARGFRQREGVDFFQTFAPTPKMTTLRVLLHIAAQRDYELHSLDFSTAFLQGSLHEQIWLSLDFFPSSADSSLFVRRGLTPFFVLVYILTRFRFPFSKVQPTPLAVDHGLTAPPSDEPFESSGPYSELVVVSCFSDSSWANDAESPRSTQGYLLLQPWHQSCFVEVDSASSVSSSSCEAEVYAAAMATRSFAGCLSSSPFSVSGLALPLSCSSTTELQQRGQTLVRRVVSEANTADIFTKALPPCDHQRFCTQLGVVSTGPHLFA